MEEEDLIEREELIQQNMSRLSVCHSPFQSNLIG